MRSVEATADGIRSLDFKRDDAGRIVSVQSQTGESTTIVYSDGETRVNGPEGSIEFETSASGRIAQVDLNSKLISADYSAEGQLAVLHSGGGSVRFGRDAMGRVSSIQYSDGTVNRYEYDSLGNRSFIEFGMGGSVRYSHDPAGNIVAVRVVERSGEEKRQTVSIGDMNRVERIAYEGLGALDFAYDEMGRAVSFSTGRDVIEVEYSGPSRIGQIVSRATGVSWSPGEAGVRERKAVDVIDARRAVLRNDTGGDVHPDYGIAGFNAISFSVDVMDPLEGGIPGLREAKRLAAVAQPLLAGSGRAAMLEFEKPSNALFQPLEYRSTNCCICLIVYPLAVPLDLEDGEVICYCQPDPPPPPTLSIGVGKTRVWPQDTGRPDADSQATITISTSNVAEGTAVSFQLQSVNDGGHVGHTGVRPLGEVTPENVSIDGEGVASAQFTASHFGGDIRIIATVGDLSKNKIIQVRVPDLKRVTAGDGYEMAGPTSEHPVGWYATSSTKTNLESIGKAYKEKYDTEENTGFEGELLRYNDMSLIYGGKFDLDGDWCTDSDHRAHRVGTEIDLGHKNVPSTRMKDLEKIVEANNGKIVKRYTNHWHVRF